MRLDLRRQQLGVVACELRAREIRIHVALQAIAHAGDGRVVVSLIQRDAGKTQERRQRDEGGERGARLQRQRPARHAWIYSTISSAAAGSPSALVSVRAK